ncbi:MAG TPA: nucleotide sugar dehydrogenase [Epulopiscium sp.]|nr:nucleotide sugar dehydrogenase [Candidatus Epulonipiscium sp.]
MDFIKKMIQNNEKVAVIGLGYVGMPLAVAFAKKLQVIGFDVNKQKIQDYKNGLDPTDEVGIEEISKTTVDFTSEEERLKEAKVLIIAVPTPVNTDKTPDLQPIIGASQIVGHNLTKGSIVIYESTVYPGVTEEICIPILEESSGLKCGVDFKVGYSPERINPGDKVHTLASITKIVSGIDQETLDIVASIYETIITAGVHKASSIKVAEAAKVVENSQRDINIAFMNELAMVFDRMEIDTTEVIEAMNTKWNALGFYPGLVGGHCIGVDPYYFIYQAEKLGYHSQIILSGRKINDGMAKFVGEAIIKQLVLANKVVKQAKVAILGVTFKENCGDIRNSKVEDIVTFLREYGIDPVIIDPVGDQEEIKSIYGRDIREFDTLCDMDCLVFAVGHDQFKDLPLPLLQEKFVKGPRNEKVIIDIKGIYNKKDMEQEGYAYWRL